VWGLKRARVVLENIIYGPQRLTRTSQKIINKCWTGFLW